MANSKTAIKVRQSVSLPVGVARRVRAIASSRRISASKVIADLLESGLRTKDRERERFLELADQLSRARDPKEQKRLKALLASLTFGD